MIVNRTIATSVLMSALVALSIFGIGMAVTHAGAVERFFFFFFTQGSGAAG
jgi:hypothetical protein